MSTRPNAHALMLRDTILNLENDLIELNGTSDFDRGYQMGLEYALTTVKLQCDVFDLEDVLHMVSHPRSLSEPD